MQHLAHAIPQRGEALLDGRQRLRRPRDVAEEDLHLLELLVGEAAMFDHHLKRGSGVLNRRPSKALHFIERRRGHNALPRSIERRRWAGRGCECELDIEFTFLN